MPEKHEAEAMAHAVERWLGNPMSREMLKLVTRRCKKDGRRAENALEAYATGTQKDACRTCKISNYLVKSVLDTVLAKIHAEKRELRARLSDPMWRKGLASVLEGIAEFGIEKPFTSYAPFLVVWNFTKGCNLRCMHCYETADVPASDELTTEEALVAVDRMADAGVAYIALSGGEPLMRKDLFWIARRIRNKGMGFSIATNGTMLASDVAKMLKEIGCMSVQVSLDGANAETHNAFRGQDAFERTLQGIKNARAEGLNVNIATTVTHHNLSEVPAILDLAENLGADFMHYNFIPTGKGKDIIGMDLTPEEREELLNTLAKETRTRKIRILSTAPQYGRVCAENEAAVLAMSHFDPTDARTDSVRFLADFIGGCGTGRLYCTLEPNGDIEPCVFIPIKLGNIKGNDILDVWHNSPVLKDIRAREKFKGNCPVCINRNICGGCRARAYAYSNDVQGPDPGCIRNKWAVSSKSEDLKTNMDNYV